MGFTEIKFPSDTLFLVTGAAGFVGSNLCEAILNMGYKVRALDDLSTGKQENVDMFLGNPNYEFIKGDIKDLDTCMKACEGVDYVLNQAAWGSVPRSLEMPLFYCKTILRERSICSKRQDNAVLKVCICIFFVRIRRRAAPTQNRGQRGQFAFSLRSYKAMRRGMGKALYHALRT